jgi:hypothetical protein
MSVSDVVGVNSSGTFSEKVYKVQTQILQAQETIVAPLFYQQTSVPTLQVEGNAGVQILGVPSAVSLPGATYSTIYEDVEDAGAQTIFTVAPNTRSYIMSFTIYNRNIVDPLSITPRLINNLGTFPFSLTRTATAQNSTGSAIDYVFGPGESLNILANDGAATVTVCLCTFPDNGSGDANNNPFGLRSIFSLVTITPTLIYTVPAASASGNPVRNAFGCLGFLAQRANLIGVGSQQLSCPYLEYYNSTDGVFGYARVNAETVASGLSTTSTTGFATGIELGVLSVGDAVSVFGSSAGGYMWMNVVEI